MPTRQETLNALLGTRIPLIQGGMTWVSGHALAAAVCEAGALGVIGSGGMDETELGDEIRALRQKTQRPFAVNIPLTNVHPEHGDELLSRCLKVTLDEAVPVVVTGAGSPKNTTPMLKEAGARVLHVVPSPQLAVKCEQAGVDAVIAESNEGGGHVRVDGLPTLALMPQVVDAVSVPVVASGGIADARGVAAAVALGAHGVQVGTRFIATVECNAHPHFKQALLDAGEESTAIYSKAYHASRALQTPAIRRLLQMEAEGTELEELLAYRGRGRARKGCIEGNLEEGILPAGTGVGLIREVLPAREVVLSLAAGFS
jgi:enoyl-[acyl-carrier protein] reductase II